MTNAAPSIPMDELGRLLSHDGTFQHAADSVLERQVKGRVAETTNQLSVLEAWADTLARQPGVRAAYVLLQTDPHGEVECRAKLGRDLDLAPDLRAAPGWERIAAVVRRGGSATEHLVEGSETRFVLAAACHGDGLPSALAAVTGAAEANRVRSLLSEAATRASIVLALIARDAAQRELAALEARDAAHRDMAARIAHLTSSSVLMALFRVDTMLGKLTDPDEAAANDLQAIRSNITDAMRGLERARLFSMDRLEATISLSSALSEVVQAVGREHPGAVAADVLAFEDCVIRNSPLGLYYALRDLVVLLWLLSGTEPRSPVRIEVRLEDACAVVELETERSLVPADARLGLLERLRDPSVVLGSPDGYVAEATVGLDLARSVIEETGGSLTSDLGRSGQGLRVQVRLKREAA